MEQMSNFKQINSALKEAIFDWIDIDQVTHVDFSQLYPKIKKNLKEAGFQIIPVPHDVEHEHDLIRLGSDHQ